MEIDKQPKKPITKKPNSQFSDIFVCNDHVTQVCPIKTNNNKKMEIEEYYVNDTISMYVTAQPFLLYYLYTK